MASMIKYYEITKGELEKKAYEEGSLYYCYDTSDTYLDSASNGRICIAKDIILTTEANKPLAPQPERLYVMIDTGTLWIHYNNAWVQLGRKAQIHFCNVTVTGGTLTISDSRISATDTAVFIPDISVADLCSAISVTCAAGSLTVRLTSSYDIFGEVIVNN